MRLKVMSYNVGGHGALWSRRHLERVAEVIAVERPDVVGLQEVHRGTWQSRFEDQAAALARATGMELGFGRSFGWGRGEFGNAVLTTGAVRSVAVHPLPGRGEPRSLLEAHVDLGGAGLRFFVTHLSAWGRLTSAARDLQAAWLAERLRGCGDPFVLAGDFNAPPGAPELRHLVAIELFQVCGDGLECTHRMTRQRLDYVLADRGWTIVGTRVPRTGPSDHWPVVVELARSR